MELWGSLRFLDGLAELVDDLRRKRSVLGFGTAFERVVNFSRETKSHSCVVWFWCHAFTIHNVDTICHAR